MYKDLKTSHPGGIRTQNSYVLEADAMATMPPRHRGQDEVTYVHLYFMVIYNCKSKLLFETKRRFFPNTVLYKRRVVVARCNRNLIGMFYNTGLRIASANLILPNEILDKRNQVTFQLKLCPS
jgi:hypothetical protein